MKTHQLIIAMITCSLIACSDSSTNARPPQTDEYSQPAYSTDTSKVTKGYVATGFYLMADNLEGIKMRKEQSNEVYSIAKTPFVAVDNIIHCSLQHDTTENGIESSIRMEFDEKGTQSFKDVTGNPLYPNIAIVVANRLLYVVEVQGQISTGKTTILLDGYSKEEMDAMLEAVNKKR
jgi:preprotein translocase subunit SecD